MSKISVNLPDLLQVGPALEVIERVCTEIGFDRVCPESLTEIAERMQSDIMSLADETSYSAPEIRVAYATTLEGFRRLLAPAL